MLSATQLSEILNSNEQDILDFKREFHLIKDNGELSELIRDIIALANSAYMRNYPESYIIFGVDDKTRDCIGIEGKLLIEKDNEKKNTLTHLQTKIDELNQREFVSLIKKFIDGYKGNIRVNYSTFNHPKHETHLVGVLVITSSFAPYVVKKEIQKIGRDGKTIGLYIQKGNAWIRDGEDKRSLAPNEILEMRDNAQSIIRQKRRDERLKNKLGELFTNWNISALNLDDELNSGPVDDALPNTPLRTPGQIEKYFYLSRYVNKQLDFLYDQDWYLNHIVISGQRSNGRTTLLNYLVNLRRGQGESLSTPILIEKIPRQPKLSDLQEYLRAIGSNLDENSKRLLIIDLPNYSGDFHSVIEISQQMIAQLKDVYIWIVCDETYMSEVFNILSSNKKQKAPLLITLDFLDKDRDSFINLMDNYFVDADASLQIAQQQNLTYRKLIEVYNFWKSGSSSFFKIETPNIIPARFNDLNIYEKLLLKLSYLVDGLEETIFNVLALALGLQLNLVERLVEKGMIFYSSDSRKKNLKPSEMIDIEKLIINDMEIRLLVNVLITIDIKTTGSINSWYIANLIGTIERRTSNAKLLVDLNRLKYRLKGAYYCQRCDEYYLGSAKGCPSCGLKRNKIYPNHEYDKQEFLLPFPNKNELSKGTFDLNRGVDPQLVHEISKCLPPYIRDV